MSYTANLLSGRLKKMQKTLILVPDLSLPGGVSSYYKALKLDTKENISYFTINKGGQKTLLTRFLRLIITYYLFFYKVIKDRYDLIHINPSLYRNSFYRDSGFIIISRMLNRKTLVFFRGWLDTYEKKIKNSRLKSFLFKISYAKADKYIVLSRLFQNKLIDLGVSSETEFFIETTVADSTYINELDLRKKYLTFKEKIVFLFLAKIEKQKGIYITIDAYREFLTKYPERKSCLFVAGVGPELVAAKRYVENLKIPDIDFLGYITEDKKKQVLLDAHVMILPSYTEGLPNCILEGMLYGMPIISRIVGGIPDIIQQSVNGYLSESFQPSVYTDFLSLLALDHELYRKIAIENNRIALKRYTSENVRERIFKIYESTIEQ